MSKEVLDQSAHLVIGAILSLIICHYLNSYAGVLITMAIATLRELIQHDFKMVGKKDLIFWFFGSLIGAAICM